MYNFIEYIAKKIFNNIKDNEITLEEISSYMEIPKDSKMGDYSFPCFKLAKILKQSPMSIAKNIHEKIEIEETIIKKVDNMSGYLNFYINPSFYSKTVLEEVANKKENYGTSDEGKGKNIVIDYSSPNIAKPFHIGHLRSTVIGGSLYKIYKALGYHVTGINHLGDYGTQFGKLIEGYKRWGEEYSIGENPIDELTKIYVRINSLCKEDESVLETCRDNFKKLEEQDPYYVKIWEEFKALSLKEFQRVYDMLNIQFDALNGEAFYTDKMPEVVKMLEKNNKLKKSEGATIVDLEEFNMAPCIIEKSNNSSTYATRDLAAILYRARTYDFDKALYVVSYEQTLHFKQVFKVAQYLDLDDKYKENLNHIAFGMVQLKSGKMSTREGNIIKLEDLLNEAISRAKEVIEEKNPELENKEEIAKKVGIGAVIFNDLANNRIKDEIFDWDIMLNFNGETGPYIQYIYVRTKSVLEKAGYVPDIKEIDFGVLEDEKSQKVVGLLYQYNETIKQVARNNEPSILSRYLIDLSQSFSSFYVENKIITEDKKLQNARLYLTYAVGLVLKQGCKLLGIDMPEKM